MGRHHIAAAGFIAALSVGPASAAVITMTTNGGTELGVATLRDRSLEDLARTAAPVDLRTAADWEDNYADDIGDAVFFAPGVAVNGLDIQEPRLSVRGFGVGNSQHRSNLVYLRDGAPLTDVHGTTNATEIDLLSTDKIEIARSVADLRDGGNLGGVVRLVSRTGKSEPVGMVARLDGGATIDGKPGSQGHIGLAGDTGSVDFYAGLTGVYENGWRDNNRRTSQQFHGNLGFQLRDNISTRFYVDVANSDTELAGGLTLAGLRESAEQPTPPISLGPLFPGGPIINLVDGARDDDFDRDLREGRVANTTQLRLLGHDIELGGHYTRRQLDSAQIDFVGVVEEDGSEWGARLRLARSVAFLGDAEYELGGDISRGTREHDRFENIDGTAGDQTADTEQRSKSLNAFARGIYRPLERLAVDFGAKFTKVEREIEDFTGDDIDTRDYTGIAARAGVTFEVSEAMQVYVGATRAYEPPTMDELTMGDPTDFADLDEQDSFSLEAGVRGRLGDWLGYDIAYYDTDVENEIINLADPGSFVSGDIFTNVDKTSHKGVEAGLDVHLFPQAMGARGSALTLRNVYAWSNHRFVDADPLGVDGNRIAGTPVHSYRGELRYDANQIWFVAANVQLARGDYFVDHENTTMVPTEPVVGFSAGYRLSDQIEVFASGENLLDQSYVAGVTPVETFNAADDRIFTPGARASVYGGLKYRF